MERNHHQSQNGIQNASSASTPPPKKTPNMERCLKGTKKRNIGSSTLYTAISQQARIHRSSVEKISVKNSSKKKKEAKYIFSQYREGKRAEKMRGRERERALTTIRETSRGVSNYFPRPLDPSVVPWSRRGEILLRRRRRRRRRQCRPAPPLTHPASRMSPRPPLPLPPPRPRRAGGGGREAGGRARRRGDRSCQCGKVALRCFRQVAGAVGTPLMVRH
jgi:hypothetical protein